MVQPAGQKTSNQRAAQFGVTRVLVLLLLCAVPILSTLAKDSIYLPTSNTAHFINIAAKMKVADAPVAVSQPQNAEDGASYPPRGAGWSGVVYARTAPPWASMELRCPLPPARCSRRFPRAGELDSRTRVKVERMLLEVSQRTGGRDATTAATPAQLRAAAVGPHAAGAPNVDADVIPA